MAIIESKVYSAEEITFDVIDLAAREEPKNVILCTPEYFNVVDVKNVHMKPNQGATKIDKAIAQWNALKKTYDGLIASDVIKEVHTLKGIEGLEDMVFAANQSFPWKDARGSKVVIMSNMKHESRKREVVHFENFYKNRSYNVLQLTGAAEFEGMGDAIPHPGKQLIYGGYGHRTTKEVYKEISKILDTPIVAIELRDERFYHLDTCFLPLSTEAVMICEEAFNNKDLSVIQQLFSQVINIPVNEAGENFSLNAHLLTNGHNKTAIIQKGSEQTNEVLRRHGYSVIELDTSEFMKSGGSVFCMKMMYY